MVLISKFYLSLRLSYFWDTLYIQIKNIFLAVLWKQLIDTWSELI